VTSLQTEGANIMNTTYSWRRLLAACCVALSALTLAPAGPTGIPSGIAAAVASSGAPIVTIDGGAVRGMAVAGGYAFRGLPYAAPPTGALRWQAPQPAADWRGVRDATSFAPNCPQPPDPLTTGVASEGCLYLNVSTPALGSGRGGGRPVLVWIHGGGLTTGAGRDYDPTKLAAAGIAGVTINYRLSRPRFTSPPAPRSAPT